MRRILHMACLAAALCLLSGPLHATEPDAWEERFFDANQAYKEGRYARAVEGYLSLVRAGMGNGEVFYNLGNAYFRLNQLGRAILNYERARLFIPRDADLNFNLSCARDQVKDQVPESRGLIETGLFWLDSLNGMELFWTFAVLNGLFWTVLLVRLFFKTEWTYYTAVILLILWLAGGLSFGLKWYQARTDRRAVVLEDEVSVRAGPDAGDTVLFKLHSGTIVQRERSEDGSALIRLSETERGWMKSGAVESVRP